jgi:hypothetical protein
MPVREASSEETPYGRYVTSDGWFVLNFAEALAVRNEEKGGAVYPIEPREARFRAFGVNVRYPASELAAKYGAAAARETEDPDEAYADWPGDYVPLRLPWPL